MPAGAGLAKRSESMKRSKFTEEHIVYPLCQAESGPRHQPLSAARKGEPLAETARGRPLD